MSGRTFPILDDHRRNRERDTCGTEVRSLPWSIVEPIRERALRFHSQTLECLAERGGLSPFELHCHLNGLDPFRVTQPAPDDLRAWLRTLGAT